MISHPLVISQALRNRLHVSTGAEIETALCILESVVPTLVRPRYIDTRKFVGPSLAATQVWGPRKLGNSESGIRGSLGLGPKRGPRKLGNSESGSWGSLGLGPKRGPRKLGNWESGIWGSFGLGPKRGPRKLGNSESGIWLSSRPDREGALESRKLGIWNLHNSILESAHLEYYWNLDVAEEYPGICAHGI